VVKNRKYTNQVQKPEQRGAEAVYSSLLNYVLLSSIIVITFWCYHYSVNNQFTNWDDEVYVTENPFIKNLSPQNLKIILSKNVTQNYYHPLTMLSLALNWHFSGASPRAYYVTEIILHLLNTVLVFFLSLALFHAMVKRGYGKINGIPYLAGLCALWFGIHPMHVESVSWIAERKDVLYLFFYLLGLITYVKYVMENKRSLMVPVVFLFLLSLLSKPMAVVFPFSLLAIDVLLKRKMEWKLLLEKIPLFAISALFGYIAYTLQEEGNAITSFHAFTLMQRVMFAGYNYLAYLIKLFVPSHLSSFYPYPEFTASNRFPTYFYIAPFAAIAITAGLLHLAYKKGENYFRVALFGFGFYFFNVMFILQFVSSGPSIMADRYSYASYIGFVFMLVYFINVLINKMPAIKTPVIVIVAVFSCMLAFVCQARTEVWHNSETLWKDVISKYPDRVEVAYKNLGNYYYLDRHQYDSAYTYYETLEQNNTNDAGIYYDIGLIWAIRKNYERAVEEYNRSLKLDSSSFDTYFNRGAAYFEMGQNEFAIRDYIHAYKLDSTNQRLLLNLGYIFLNRMKNYDAATAIYSRLIAIDPTNVDYYYKRGITRYNNGNFKEAIDDFNKEISVNPQKDTCLFFLSLTYMSLKSYPAAIDYAQRAQQYGFKIPNGYMELLKRGLAEN